MPLNDEDILNSFVGSRTAQPTPTLAPDPKAPSAPIKSDDDILDTFMNGNAAKAKAVGALGSSPDEAAKAQKLSKPGLPPEVAITDTKGFGDKAKIEAANKAISYNTHLQNFVNTVPLAEQHASDSWPQLDTMSTALDWLTKEGHDKRVDASLMASSPAMQALSGWASGRLDIRRKHHDSNIEAFDSAFAGKSVVDSILYGETQLPPLWTTFLEATMVPTGGRALEGLIRAGVGSAKMLGSKIAGEMVDFGLVELPTKLGGPKYGDPETKLRRDIDVAIDAEMARSVGEVHLTPPSRAQIIERFQRETREAIDRLPRGPPSLDVKGFVDVAGKSKTRDEMNEFLRQQSSGKYDTSRFKDNPELQKDVAELQNKSFGKDIEPKNSIEVQKAQVAAESVNEAVTTAQTVPMKERSPEVFEKFIESKGEVGTVYLPAETVLKLYKSEGKMPTEGDGLLGFVPDLMKKAALAAETGSEIAIPLSKYIAHIDPALHAKLAEDLRLHDDGVTLTEADEIKNKEPESKVHQPVIDYLATVQPKAFEPGRGKPVEGELEREIKAEETPEDEPAEKVESTEPDKVPAEKPATDLAAAEEKIKSRPGGNLQRLARMAGPQLYGDPTNMDQVTIKEMLQNSFDSLKALIEKGQIKNPKIDIKFDRKTRTISILDNGTGMTPETLGGPFLRIADTLKETANSSGGFGIAKMLFLFGNKQIRVTTMRDGKVSTLVSSGEQLFAALEDDSKAPFINAGEPTKEQKAMFPDGHGTKVEVVVPETFQGTDGEAKGIEFRPQNDYWHEAVNKSPLFHDIEVNWDAGRGAEKLPIGKNFPYNDFTQFANVKFGWGSARIYVSKSETKISDWDNNVHILSNGIYQFGIALKKDPANPYGPNLPRELYIDINSKAQPTESGYPFDLNRQGFTKMAKEDLAHITNYISGLYSQEEFANAVKNFGDIEYYDESGKPGDRIKLEPELPPRETALSAISGQDQVTVRDGQLIVNGRKIKELSKQDLQEGKALNIDELKIDQSKIDPTRVMLHDNIEVLDQATGQYRSLVEVAREKFGPRFDSYAHGIGDKFRELRDVVAALMDYPDLAKEAIGLSFDKEYRGVSIKIPFSGMFLNVAVPRYTDPIRAAVGMIGTMIHEFAHHKVRNHNAEFPAEMQDIQIALDTSEHMEGARTSLTDPKWYSLLKLKEDTIKIVKEHEDVLKWLNSTITADNRQQIPFGQDEPERPLVRNRGKRFKDAGSRQASDAGVYFNDTGPAAPGGGGHEGVRPAFQELGPGKGPPGVPENPELTKARDDVNKSMVATQAVVAAKKAKRELYLEPLFKDNKALNVDKVSFKRYSDLIENSQIRVLTKSVELTKKLIGRKRTAEWKLEEDKMRDLVTPEIENSPAFAADKYFNTDKGLIPGGSRIAKTKFDDMPLSKADELAPVFGFDTGADMIKGVMELKAERDAAGKGPKWQLSQHVDAEVARRMEAKHGSLQDNIAIEASEEALANYNLDILDEEIKLLAEAHGVEPPLTRADLDTWLKEKFGGANAKDISYEKERRATERAGKNAEKGLLKGSVEEALLAKQEQAKSFILSKEAKKFEKERARDKKLFDKYADAVTLPKVAQEYTDQIHRELNGRGYKLKRTAANIAHNVGSKAIGQFIEEKAGQGRLIIDAELAPEIKLDDMTVDQYRDWTNMIRSMDHNGRFEKVIEIRGKREDYFKVIDEAAKNLDRLEKNNFDLKAEGPIAGIRGMVRYIDSKLLKPERLLDWIDREDPQGALNQSILRGLIEGEQGKGDMMTTLAGLARKIPADYKWSHNLNTLTKNEHLRDEDGKLHKLTNENKISIALNYGNRGNRDVMTRAHGWSEVDIETFLDKNMTAQDWKVVDGIYDLFAPLAPLVERATSRRTGVAVPLVEPLPYLGSKGGYYPLIADPLERLIGAKVKTDLFDKTKFDPLPTAPALHQRTGAVYKLDFSLNYINNILSQTTHAVFMQEPVINANKIIKDPIIRDGIVKAFGPEYVNLLDDWIKDIANNGRANNNDSLSWLSRELRQNVVTQLMGYKFSTAVIHGVSAAMSSMYELGKLHLQEKGSKSFVLAPAELAKNIKALGLGNLPAVSHRFFNGDTVAMYNEVQSLSGEIRNRQRNIQKDFGFQLDKLFRKDFIDDLGYFRAIHQAYAMAMVGYIDLLSATPVWKASYDAARQEGVEQADAVYQADKAVREAHGSASLVARANVGRGETGKWLTIAYNGYWNHNYNKYRSEYKNIFRGEEAPTYGKTEAGTPDERFTMDMRVAMGAAFLTALIVVPAIIHHVTRGEQQKTLGGEIAAMGLSQVGGTVPIVNSLLSGMIHGRDPSVSPLDDVLKTAADLWKDEMVTRHPRRQISHAAKAFGYATGFPPTNQIIDSSSFANEVLHGRKQPESVGQWARGLLAVGDKGKKK